MSKRKNQIPSALRHGVYSNLGLLPGDALRKQADEEAKTELGAAALELIEAGDVVTIDYLLNELSIIERLDQMIDHCLKQLAHVRGVKSLSSPAAATFTTRRLPKAA